MCWGAIRGVAVSEALTGLPCIAEGGINTYAMVCEDGSQGADPPHTEADTGGQQGILGLRPPPPAPHPIAACHCRRIPRCVCDGPVVGAHE